MSRRNSLLVLTLALFEVLAVGSIGEHSNRAAASGAPAGKWDVTFQPYTGKDADRMPVQVLVFDVQIHEHSMWVREWQLRNRTMTTVVRIRPALFVSKEEDPGSPLFHRELRSHYGLTLPPGFQWPGGPCLPQAKSCRNAFATLSLDELMEPLLRDGQDNTKYRVSLGIDKVWFEGGTVWEFDQAQK